MKLTSTPVRFVLASTIGCGCLVSLVRTLAASPNSSTPPVIQAGFTQWAKNGATLALDAWQKGGLLEGDNKVASLANYFRRLDRALGNYKAYEWVDAKRVSDSSQIIYVSINFERGAVYARFLLYRTDKSWVVQNMDFNTRPEAIMPWLAFAGGNYTE